MGGKVCQCVCSEGKGMCVCSGGKVFVFWGESVCVLGGKCALRGGRCACVCVLGGSVCFDRDVCVCVLRVLWEERVCSEGKGACACVLGEGVCILGGSVF